MDFPINTTARLQYERWIRFRPWYKSQIPNNMNTNYKPGSMPYDTETDRMNVFRAGYEFATRNRPKHCTTKIELFKRFWSHNLPFVDCELNDQQIEQWIAGNKSIGDAVYSAANWQLDQPTPQF